MNQHEDWICTCVACGQPCEACTCGDEAVWVERCRRCGRLSIECVCDDVEKPEVICLN